MTASVPEPGTGLPIGAEVDATPARRPERTIALEGQRVRLVPIEPARDAAALFTASRSPEGDPLWTYMGSGPFADPDGFRAYLDKAAGLDDPFMLAIRDRATDEALGHATYMRIEPAHRVIEVGNILFTPRLQGTPAATEAMYLMARHAFEAMGYRRYEWKCNALNAPSRRAARRLGFAYEGLFRDHMIIKGRSRDTAWFSMVATEWPARRAAFERWLSPRNFDAAGRQRLSLSALNDAEIPEAGLPLRRAGAPDATAFERLQQAAFAPNRAALGMQPLPLLTPAAEILSGRETWLAEDEGLAGALVLTPEPDHLEIWSIATDPARQGRGLGRRMMAAAESRARALGLRTLRLFTGAPLTRTVAWYERQGYAVERHEDLPDGRRLVHLTKHIRG